MAFSRSSSSCSCKAEVAMDNDTKAGMRGWGEKSVTQPNQTVHTALAIRMAF